MYCSPSLVVKETIPVWDSPVQSFADVTMSLEFNHIILP